MAKIVTRSRKTAKPNPATAPATGATEKDTSAKAGITRRQLLQWSAAAGAVVAIGLPRRSRAATCSGLNAIEAWPVSPLILKPFTDPLPIPTAQRPETAAEVSTWTSKPGPEYGCQDCDGGTHQLYPGQSGTVCEGMPAPLVYRLPLRVGAHRFSSSPVRTLVPYRNGSKVISAGTVVSALPPSTIYGFNGAFPGARINAEYGRPNVLRFVNELDQNPLGLDRMDFGDPEYGFLTHLHNGHTAAESDGNPHHKPEAYRPGGWCDNLYLNHPAGGDDAEKMSFLWFHDHREGHTGANVYKGMVGLYPIYDPVLDPGDETKGLRLPGVRRDNGDGSFDVDYDIPLALYDCALDDGAVPHQDFHNGCGESHPEWWGKTFFRHFPNHGFVGDVFTVNGKAYPVLTVKRRKYRLRFLTAAISRQFELSFMTSKAGPRAAVDMGLKGADLQGQWRIPDGVQCLRMTEIATGGGLLPTPIVRDNVENWPAMRHEVVVDFTKTMDGKPTRKGDVMYLVNTLMMPDGRQATRGIRLGNADPTYKVPLLKIVIGDDAPDNSLMPVPGQTLRPAPSMLGNPALLPQRRIDLQRGSAGGEIQWLINGFAFDPHIPLFTVKQGRPEVWTITNGGGWSHPMHFHMEEHKVLTRNGKVATTVNGHADDTGKDDVLAIDPSETISIYRNFRTFTGKYVAHCHNLAHEDHAMMFGWELVK